MAAFGSHIDGWLDRASGSADDGGYDARLPAGRGARVGHSMNLELPALYAGYFGAWFGGLAT